MKKIILASGSEQRKLLLENIGLKFKVEKSDYEEDMGLKLKPHDLAKFLSKAKAQAVAKKHKKAIVIGTDSFIVFKGKLLGKPHTEKRAREMLEELSGKWHSAITGFTVIDTTRNKTMSESRETKVYVKKMTPREIEDYVKTKEPLNKAGSYGIQRLGSFIIEKINGDYTNVVGLPMPALADVLRKLGVNVFDKKWRRSFLNKK
jgi:septum formation protein